MNFEIERIGFLEERFYQGREYYEGINGSVFHVSEFPDGTKTYLLPFPPFNDPYKTVESKKEVCGPDCPLHIFYERNGMRCCLQWAEYKPGTDGKTER